MLTGIWLYMKTSNIVKRGLTALLLLGIAGNYTLAATDITLIAGDYNRVCLPFDLDAEQMAATFTSAYMLAGVTADGVGQLVPVATIEAGKAYFVTVDATKTLTVSDVPEHVARPESIPVIWEGAATVGTYDGFTFDVNLSEGYSITSYVPVNFQNMSFTVNLENWHARRFLQEVSYDENTPSKIEAYNQGSPMLLDQPHSVFIPVPQNNSDLIVTVSGDDGNESSFTFAAGTTLCEVPNLIPQNTYYYRVEASGTVLTQGQFMTEGHLRMIKTDTGFNIRDLGGWELPDGNRMRYGKIFRGGELNFGHTMSTDDLQELRRLGCTAELDWRCNDECEDTEPGESVFGDDAAYCYFNQACDDMSFGNDENKDHYRRAFAFTLDNLRDDRAVYVHGRMGADRTGMFAMLIEGLCGMSYDQIAKDYELSSYSEAGTRMKNSDDFTSNLNYINALPGITLQQKFFYYIHYELGIDSQDILDFVENMTGDTGKLVNQDLCFVNDDDSYHQDLSTIVAVCNLNSELAGDSKKAVLSKFGEFIEDVDMQIDAIFITFGPLSTTLESGCEYTLTIPAGTIQKDGVENSSDETLTFQTPPHVTISETDDTAPAACEYANVTLTRTLLKEKWNTFSVPFSLTADQLSASPLAGSTLYAFKKSDATSISFQTVTTVEAGQPYLLKLPETQTEDIVNPTFKGVTIVQTEGMTQGESGHVQFASQIYNKSLSGVGDVCYLSAETGYLKKLTATGAIKGLRCYFIVPDAPISTSNIKMVFDDDMTIGTEGIDPLPSTLSPQPSAFDLMGRQIVNSKTVNRISSQGIYIVDGKIIIVK